MHSSRYVVRLRLTHEGKFMLYLYVFKWMPDSYEDIEAGVIADSEEKAIALVKIELVQRQLAGNNQIPYLYPVDPEEDCLTITKYDISTPGLKYIGIDYRD